MSDLTQLALNLGYCEEAQTYCSVAEERYKQGRADAIREIEKAMYNEAFEVSHEEDGLQKWDSGNWIRYKLFENVIERLKLANGSSIEEENK